MRTLALVARDIPYIRDNWANAVHHVLAEDVTMVNVSAWLVCAPKESHQKAIYRLLATGAYDYLFLYHDYIFGDFPDEFFGNVRSAGVKTLAFHPDDEPETWYQRNRVFDGRFDLVASHCKRGVERRTAEKRPTQSMYLPWGFNQRFFDRPKTRVKPAYDVTFVGKYKVHDQDQTAYREDGERRDAALNRVAKLCKRRGWTFGLFGWGWDKHPTLSRFAGGLLTQEQMVQTYHASRIVLNPGWTSDPGDPVPQTKLRHFEVPGAGAFQLTNANPELGELFEEGKEVGFFNDNDDLCDKIAYYLKNDKQRQAIADAGYARAHREHTLDHRVRTLFAEAEKRWPARKSVMAARPMPRIQTCHVRTIDEVRELRDRFVANPNELAGVDAVHVLACDGEVGATHYGALRDWWRADASVFGARTFYSVPDVARNPVHPRRNEITGGFLKERVSLDTVPAWQRDQLPKFAPLVVNERHAFFLMNYIARRDAIVPLLDAFLSRDAAQLEALNPLDTGLVIAEVYLRLVMPEGVEPVPPYVAPLKTLLRQAAALDQKVAIYGARGDMAEVALDVVRQADNVKLVGLFDRAMAGQQVAGVPVYSSFDIPEVAPDVLLIAAAISGPAIYEQLKPLESRMAVVPLYDVAAPTWNVLISQ